MSEAAGAHEHDEILRRVLAGHHSPAAEPPAPLTEVDWKPVYTPDDGDPLEMFFVPALSRAVHYQRITGYFSHEALALAARGLEAFIQHGGRMQLLAGCTLEPEEIEQINKGYSFREMVAKNLSGRISQLATDTWSRERLGWLAWMVAHGYLDVKVAVPLDEKGEFRPNQGLFHAKCGILTDAEGNQLVFSGSINETLAGWRHNSESFDVNCTWWGAKDVERAASHRQWFEALWADRSPTAKVVDVPEAVRDELLRFLPDPEAEPTPSVDFVCREDPAEPTGEDNATAKGRRALSVEQRAAVWRFLVDAFQGPGGPSLTLETSVIKPWPHQLRVFRRMVDAWPVRLLIADEVGLGKTIEAGMLLRYAWLSGKAKRILLLAPKSVLAQWQSELYEKFNLVVPIYTGKSLVWPAYHGAPERREEPVGRDAWTEQVPFVLVSSHLMRRTERQPELLEGRPWDLVLLDEAHHARRRGVGAAREEGPNQLLGLMHKLKDKTESLLLLTATPMQIHPTELWDLLALLGLPPEWDEDTFQGFFETIQKAPDVDALFRLAKLTQAADRWYEGVIERAVEQIGHERGLNAIRRGRIKEAIREPRTKLRLRQLPAEEREAVLECLVAASPARALMSRHTRNLLREYRRRGLLDQPIADRMVRQEVIDMTPEERAIYEEVDSYIATAYNNASQDKRNAVGFIMTVYRRRVASSFAALRRTLEKRLARMNAPAEETEEGALEEDLLLDDSADEPLSEDDAAHLERQALEAEEKDRIQTLLRETAKLSTDSKAVKLVERLSGAFEAGYACAIVFTQYTDTMNFLRDFVADRLDTLVACYSGGGGARRMGDGRWQTVGKEELRRELAAGRIGVLLCTDAAAEGLNLQYAGYMVNYDLPWNPMKLEQRIGRIDRIGQIHKTVEIVNMGYKDTIETDVYNALYERISLFKGFVGKLQPILARLPQTFERAVLEGAHDPAGARSKARAEVEALVAETEQTPFDIDKISEAYLEPPGFSAAPYTPASMENLLRTPQLLPPGYERAALDERTHKLTTPSMSLPVRITTDPAVFEDRFESHQLFLPGGPLFDATARAALKDADPARIPAITDVDEYIETVRDT